MYSAVPEASASEVVGRVIVSDECAVESVGGTDTLGFAEMGCWVAGSIIECDLDSHHLRHVHNLDALVRLSRMGYGASLNGTPAEQLLE